LRSTVKIFHPNLVINLPTRGANIPTSFPGSSLFLRKDLGRGWSRAIQNVASFVATLLLINNTK
jgi:hypothetical protein